MPQRSAMAVLSARGDSYKLLDRSGADEGEKSRPSSVLENVVQRSAKLRNVNKRFFNNVTLALSMAFWVTFFGLPCYSPNCSRAIFGMETCNINDFGFKINIGSDAMPLLVSVNSTLIAKHGTGAYVWCGLLPEAYFKAWPNVVQTMLFTVFLSTGSTVKLAWQGLAGTFCAVANVYMMCMKYPMGGADPNYSEFVAYLDLFLVLFLFLATKADTNTMMWGMSWTVSLMMDFMNPNTIATTGSLPSPIPGINTDGETTITLLTAFVGCSLAVLATVMPRPLLNIRNVHADCEEIIRGVDQIFQEAIEYWEANEPTMRRFSLYAKMSQLTEAVDRVSKNLEDAYWETFDFGFTGKTRNLYSMFCQAIDGTSIEVFLLKSATSVIDFEGTFHQEVVKCVKEPLRRLKTNAVDCLAICGKACKDGIIEPEEKQTIEQKRGEIEKAQIELADAFVKLLKTKDYVSEETAGENLFIFGISQWAQDSSDFAFQLLNREDLPLKKKTSKFSAINFIRMICQNIAITFDPRDAFKPEQLRYVFVNLMPIGITYAVSMYAEGSVFTRYSTAMPYLLTLLVTSDHGIPFMNNAQRLTGVVFGHTLPLLMMSAIHLMDCHSIYRTFMHAISIFVYFFSFTFMYYASASWSSVGKLVAGFGVYGLLVPCHNRDGPADYRAEYKQLVQVIIAMMLKMAFTQAFAKTEPRDVCVKKVKEINLCINKAFETFFSGDMHGQNGFQVRRTRLKNFMQELEALAPMSDPTLSLVPGVRTPFKYSLLMAGLQQYRLFLTDLDMLMLAMVGHVQSVVHDKSDDDKIASRSQDEEEIETKKMQQELALHKLMRKQKSWEALQKDVKETVRVTLELFEAILEHDSEEPVKEETTKQITTMTNVNKLDDLIKFYKDVSDDFGSRGVSADLFLDKRLVTEQRRTRLSVAMNALSLAVTHATDLAAACFDNMSDI